MIQLVWDAGFKRSCPVGEKETVSARTDPGGEEVKK